MNKINLNTGFYDTTLLVSLYCRELVTLKTCKEIQKETFLY